MASPLIALIDYGAGNLHSVEKAIRHVMQQGDLTLATKGDDLRAASHIILPGVGAFADCMAGLRSLPGMLEALEQEVRITRKPFLGICVGMQMLFERGLEHGEHEGLGWIEGEVQGLGVRDLGFGICETAENSQLATRNSSLKIPHMGWNDLQLTRTHPLVDGIAPGDHAYFVHSYHCIPRNKSDILATVDYGQTVVAAIQRDNIMATQFHPEKSQQTGLRLLKNFIELHSL